MPEQVPFGEGLIRRFGSVFDLALNRRAAALARKEARHVLRDPFSLAMSLVLPLVMLLLFGYAVSFDMLDLRLSVLDQDRSRASRELVEALRASGFFLPSPSSGDPEADVASERVRAALVIPAGFQRSVGRGEPAEVELLIDGSDNATASAAQAYLLGAASAAWGRIAGLEGARAPAETLGLRVRYAFNGELNSRWFIVPGLIAVIVGFLSMLLTALTVAREWESGSMELLLSTPARPLDIILGKLAPYLLLSVADMGMVYAAARILFQVPFRGSHLLLGLACLLFLFVVLAQGLLVSVASRNQALAFQASMVIGVLPVMLLSGFIFPIESMPAFFRWLTAVLPPRWFIEILRGLFLKGAGAAELALPFAMLAAMSLLLTAAAVRKFKTDLEP